MNSRTGLIERAAARLRDANDPVVPAPVAPVPSEAPVPFRATVAPLARKIVLDRVHLAQMGIMMPWASTARIVEEYRTVKRNIIASWQSSDSETGNYRPRVIMVTSARPREGKTFSSVNLALAFAADENLATVLIDADAMRRDCARVLSIPEEPGFTDLLAGKGALSDTLIQTDLQNLLVLPSGPSGAHVPELLHGPGPGALFDEIAKRYPNHVIILDTPPCLASTDPAALAPIAGQIVFVIEAEHTQREEIDAALSLISSCPRISLLLNLIPPGANEHFGSYSYYYQPQKSDAKV